MATETLAEAIRTARGEMSQETAARRVGVTQSAWSKWEKGTQTPLVSQVMPLAELSGRSTDEWLALITAEQMKRGSKRDWALQLLDEARRLLEDG